MRKNLTLLRQLQVYDQKPRMERNIAKMQPATCNDKMLHIYMNIPSHLKLTKIKK